MIECASVTCICDIVFCQLLAYHISWAFFLWSFLWFPGRIKLLYSSERGKQLREHEASKTDFTSYRIFLLWVKKKKNETRLRHSGELLTARKNKRWKQKEKGKKLCQINNERFHEWFSFPPVCYFSSPFAMQQPDQISLECLG